MTYSCGFLHLDEQRQDDQLEPIYNSSVLILDVALNTCRKRWTIEKDGEKVSEISVLAARHDDDDFSHYIVLFYGVSTFVGYSTPNSVYIHIPFTNEYLVGRIFYKQDFTCLHLINSFNSSYFSVQPCFSQEGQNVIYFDVFEQFG